MKKHIFIWILTLVLLSSFAFADLETSNEYYFSFDDADVTAGNPDDLSINNNDGTSINTPTTGVTGIILEAFNYNGVNSYVETVTNTIPNGDYSFSVWVKSDSSSNPSGSEAIYAVQQESSKNTVFLLFNTAGSLSAKHQGDNTNEMTITTSVDYYDAAWHNVIINYDSSADKLNMYVDGVFEKTVTDATTNGAIITRENFIGNFNDKGTPSSIVFDGNIDEFSMWQRILTDGTCSLSATCGGEVAELYNSGAANNFYSVVVTDNFTITVNDAFDNTALSAITANITFTNGSSVVFSNSTGNFINTNILANHTTLFNITLNSSNYFNEIVLNQNASSNLVATLNQTKISFNAFDIFNNSISVGNITINAQTNPLSYIWPLKANSYNATFSGINFLDKTQEITVSALEISTQNITDIFNIYFGVNATDFVTNGTINTFNVSITQNSVGYNIFKQTTGGELSFNLLDNVLYNITVLSNGYLIYNRTDYNVSTNLTAILHSSTSIATFLDSNTSAGIPNKGVTITYPGGFQLPLITNENGTVSWVTIVNGIELYGEYNITLDSTTGYDSPQSFLENITVLNAPINRTYLIDPAALNITIRDQSTGELITQEVIVTIIGIGQFNVTGGNLLIVNGSIAADSYTLYALSAGYVIGQTTFDYNAREVENIDIFLIQSNATNTGTVTTIIFDEGFNTQLGADVRLLQYFADVDSFIQVDQCFSNANGECFFGVQLGTTLYIITATKDLGTVDPLSGVSSTTGEIFFIDNYNIDLHMFPTNLYQASDLVGFFINPQNVSLVGNTSFLTGVFTDVNNVVHEVCIAYFREGLGTRTEVANNCINASAASINIFGGFLLNRSNTYTAEFYVVQEGGFRNLQFSIIYTSLFSFEEEFGLYAKYIILGSLLFLLSISLYLKNIFVFAIGGIFVIVLFIYLLPSFVGWSVGAIFMSLDCMLMYLGRKKEGNISV